MQENIVVTAKEMFLKNGFKTVTMDDIAQEMGISKKTLYEHFNGKEELVKSVLYLISQQVDAKIKSIQSQNLHPIEELIEEKNSISEIVPNEYQDNAIFQLNKYYCKIFKKFQQDQVQLVEDKIKHNLTKGIEQGCYRTVNIDTYARIYYMGIMFSKQEEFIHGFKARDIEDSFIGIFLRGIVNKEGVKFMEEKGVSL